MSTNKSNQWALFGGAGFIGRECFAEADDWLGFAVKHNDAIMVMF